MVPISALQVLHSFASNLINISYDSETIFERVGVEFSPLQLSESKTLWGPPQFDDEKTIGEESESLSVFVQKLWTIKDVNFPH